MSWIEDFQKDIAEYAGLPEDIRIESFREEDDMQPSPTCSCWNPYFYIDIWYYDDDDYLKNAQVDGSIGEFLQWVKEKYSE